MASGHMNRVKRPDTWLHRPMLQNVKKVLANPEPSTHDPTQTSNLFASVAGCKPSQWSYAVFNSIRLSTCAYGAHGEWLGHQHRT
jgi:hypothetical protein